MLVKPERIGEGIMRVVSPEQMMKQDDEAKEKASEIENKENILNGLAAHIQRQWQAAKQSKYLVEERIIKSLRQRNGEYDPKKLGQIRAHGGSEIFMMLTNIKCRAAESWVNDILFPSGDKFWSIEPTPVPELPPDIVQSIEQEVNMQAQQAQAFAVQQGMPPVTAEEVTRKIEEIKEEFNKRIQKDAQERCERMERRMDDQLQQAEWDKAIKEFIKDVVTFPAGILKGPVLRKKRTLKYVRKNGKFVPQIGSELAIEFYRVSPFDYFPSPNARTVNDGYQIERHRLRRKDLIAMKGVPGYDDEAIEKVLAEYGRGGLRQWLSNDQIRADLEGRPNEWMAGDETIDALEYYGSVPGSMLREWGMSEKDVTDETQEYETNVWLIGNYIIRAVLNPDPLDRRPYHKASFEEIPGAFWGYGLPEIMEDDQDVCNGAARALINNMGIASGPMVEVHTDRLAPGEDVTQLYPWRIFQTNNDPNGTNNPAVRFYQPTSNADVLLKVYDHFSRLADEHTGIPPYTYGDPSGQGAASTASGLSMLMSAASRGIKQVIAHMDAAFKSALQLVYEHNMLYDEDESIKGDLKIIAKGSTSLIAKEQKQIRISEFLDRTNNPVDMSIIGTKGRANIVREAAKSLEMAIDEIVPDDEELNARIKQEAMQGMNPPQGEAPQTLDPAGRPVSGQDAALFQQQ